MHAIEVAGVEHVVALAPRLRAADLAEIQASSGKDPEGVLLCSVALSDAAWAWCIDGTPVLIGGLAPHPENRAWGVPWALGSEDASRHPRQLVGLLVTTARRALLRYERLENYVDARNHKALAFLRWAGFAIHEAEPYGVAGLPFHRFTLERADV